MRYVVLLVLLVGCAHQSPEAVSPYPKLYPHTNVRWAVAMESCRASDPGAATESCRTMLTQVKAENDLERSERRRGRWAGAGAAFAASSQSSPEVNCTSRTIGAIVYTNCN